MAKPEVTYLLNQEGKDREVFINAAKAGEAWHKADVNSKPMMFVEANGSLRPTADVYRDQPPHQVVLRLSTRAAKASVLAAKN